MRDITFKNADKTLYCVQRQVGCEQDKESAHFSTRTYINVREREKAQT